MGMVPFGLVISEVINAMIDLVNDDDEIVQVDFRLNINRQAEWFCQYIKLLTQFFEDRSYIPKRGEEL